MITPAVYDFNIPRGATLRKSFVWRPSGVAAVLSGYSGELYFWKFPRASTDTAILTLTNANGGILFNTYDGNAVLAGAITLFATHTQMNLLTDSVYSYGLKLVNPVSDVLPFLSGNITFIPSNV